MGRGLAGAEWQMLWLEASLGTPIATRQTFAAAPAERVLAHVRSASPWRDHLLRNPAPPQPQDVITRSDPALPEMVRNMSHPPFGLQVRGNRELLTGGPRVAVVGSRHPRSDSLVAARRIARELAEYGATVVSGLAIGIDGAAHLAALDAGGTTIAVLGSGPDHVHPRSHRKLAQRMIDSGRGLVVSEYLWTTPALPFRFKLRNRLIAALSDLVVVVQARRASGSMQTADHALSLGVEVGVVPSGPGDVAYEGSLELLAAGARAVIDGRSALGILGHDVLPPEDLHRYGRLLQTPRTPDELAAICGEPVLSVAAELQGLEMAGRVRRDDFGAYENVPDGRRCKMRATT